jgi:hypothetical protein
MALQISLLAKDTLVGEAFPESYVKVEFVRAFKADSLIWVNFYANGTARADMKHPVKQTEYTVSTASLVGANIIAASYEHLKTLPEFAGAVDVLVTPEPSIVPPPPPVIEVPERPVFPSPVVEAIVEPVVEPEVTQPADESVN